MGSVNHGRIVFRLEEYLTKHNISKNYVVKGANIQRTQFQKYYLNKVARIDLPVLARICDCLGCSLTDIMEYLPPETDSVSSKNEP